MKTVRVPATLLLLLLTFQAGRALAQTAPPKNPPKPFVPPPFHLPQKPDFRQAHWGMTAEEVKHSETVELQAAERSETGVDILLGTSSVAEMPCAIIYEFAENKLVSANYEILGKIPGAVPTKRHTADNKYLDDYETIKGILSEKYGTPLGDETTWRNPLYRDDPSQYGFAVSLGHLSKLAVWQTPTTRVAEVISGDNYDITIVVRYQSLALLDLAEKARKAKAKSPF